MKLKIDEAKVQAQLDKALQLAIEVSESSEVVTQSYDLSMDITNLILTAIEKGKLSHAAIAMTFVVSLSSLMETYAEELAEFLIQGTQLH